MAAAAARKGAGSGRSSVTLADLVGAGLVAPGSGCISVSYKNQAWTADLAADGAIEFEGGARGCASWLQRCGSDFYSRVHLAGTALAAAWHLLPTLQPALLKDSCGASPAAVPLPQGLRFSSTTAFSIHCKRKIMPGKQVRPLQQAVAATFLGQML